MIPKFKEAVIYQIYPRSFLDTNGDGIGDLPGIIAKLDYLKELGVTHLWISPFFKSPMRDNGYDIADYYSVDPIFGTNSDLDRLLLEAKKRGLGILLDLVVNHTSDQNRWFIEAKKGKDNPFRDFYLWRDAPNSLTSVFGGSAWEFDKTTGQYYFHLFAKEQPDLNWKNPALRDAVYQMMNYWLDKGVAGFRMDVIENIGKDVDAGVTANGPHLHDYLQEMSRKTFGRKDAITIGECWSADDVTRTLYTDPKRHELNMVFQFDQFCCFWDERFGKWASRPFDLVLFKKHVFSHQNTEKEKSWPTLFWDNHDLPRALSLYCSKEHRWQAAKMLFGIHAFLRGSLFIYQGDEIGMINAAIDHPEDFSDLESVNAYRELQTLFPAEKAFQMVKSASRDNARIPMQWSSNGKGGFTDGIPWMAVSKDAQICSVEEEMRNPDSVLSFYRKTLLFRQKIDPTLLYEGDVIPLAEDDPCLFAYKRKYGKSELIVIANFSSRILANPFPDLVPAFSNEPSWNPKELPPYAFAVFTKRGAMV